VSLFCNPFLDRLKNSIEEAFGESQQKRQAQSEIPIAALHRDRLEHLAQDP